MITKIFKKYLAFQLEGIGATGDCILPAKNLNGADMYLSSRGYIGAFPVSCNYTVQTSKSSGILIGSGTTPATENDYFLQSQITSGFTHTVTLTQSIENDSPVLQYNIIITNTSASNLVISEIGYAQSLFAHATQGGSPANTDYFLFDRTVLDTPITIPAGESAGIKYKLKTVIS